MGYARHLNLPFPVVPHFMLREGAEVRRLRAEHASRASSRMHARTHPTRDNPPFRVGIPGVVRMGNIPAREAGHGRDRV